MSSLGKGFVGNGAARGLTATESRIQFMKQMTEKLARGDRDNKMEDDVQGP